MDKWFPVPIALYLCLACCWSTSSALCNVAGGTLDLDHLIGHIDSTFFNSCIANHSDIEEIDMSGNNITGVDPGTFVAFYNVRKINISSNGISYLNKTTFISLTKLEDLDLSYNLLTKLEVGLFDLFHLRKLYLQNNVISEIEPGIISEKNEYLYYVNLNNNSLTTFEPWPYLIKLTDDRYLDRVFDIQYNNIAGITNNMNWTYNLKWPFQVIVNLQHNNITTFDTPTLREFTNFTEESDVITTWFSLNINSTQNGYFCDCQMYSIADIIKNSIFRYREIESYRYRCIEPSHLSGLDWLHEVYLSELVCNITIDCPSGCFCQDRPHNDTFYINCIGTGLTEIPPSIPQHNRSKIEMFLDNNQIKSLSGVNYINQVYNLSISNNLIESLNTSVIKDLPSDSHLNLRFNRITDLPRDIQRFSYDNVQVRGNPIRCDCNSMWISEWIQLYQDLGDTGITCTSKEGVHTLTDISLEELGCIPTNLTALYVSVSLVVALAFAILAFSRICPYETKVILHNIFNIHPSDKYEVDGDDDKEVDIYLIFDKEDDDAYGYIRYFINKLNRKKPRYSILNPCRFTEGGSELDNRSKWIGKSRRVIILLSEKLLEREGDIVDIAENYLTEVQAQQNLESVAVGEPDELDAIEERVQTAANVIYIIHNKENERLLKTLEEEPWKSRLKDKTVLTCGQRMFWSKLRYELPKKGRGTGADGNFELPHHNNAAVRQASIESFKNIEEVLNVHAVEHHNRATNIPANVNFENAKLGPQRKNLHKVLQLENQLNVTSGQGAKVNKTITIRHTSSQQEVKAISPLQSKIQLSENHFQSARDTITISPVVSTEEEVENFIAPSSVHEQRVQDYKLFI